ncbi:MAG: glycosyl hydrolase [Chloroflexi bacterium]|nr:glycosyl hydrolase [Chloroflexota bacterium]
MPDEHYAAIVHTSDPVAQQWFLDTLGTKWFLDWNSNVDVIPNGHEKIIPILSLPGPSAQSIQEIADLAPGSVWYIVGEPNRRDGYGASDIVTQLHDLYTAIKDADPTARITSPSILNWEFTCNGCSGYQKGSEWVAEFRAAYLTQIGEEPPIDIWAIDVYPLDWVNLPTVDHQLAIDQVDDMRQYLDAVGQQNKPIWITELGLHWGWDAMLFSNSEEYDISCDPNPQPAGEYKTQMVIDYLVGVFDWLDANAAGKKIEKWFLFSTYRDITKCDPSAYAGLTLFNGPGVGAALTPVGQFFRDRVLGISP